ncbi:MAG: ureidoglycolate lyase [Sporomusa sp.]|jgi:2-keto-4-pentenoate hydratase/2-oxohepta-3-ene-1,7-dioic acid hydratase in catechol pathway|nr:ureidoglycolate lyase [Sporomusa sp.]
MKLVRFEFNNRISYGILVSDNQISILETDIFSSDSYIETGKRILLDDVKLLAPCLPSKAVCIGLNYHDHAREMNLKLPEEPLIFLKPSSALNHPGGDIEYPAISQNLHYEGELAIVIKAEARKVPIETAAEYVLGYTCANDVTARDIQMHDGQWTRGKSFDTFLPLGPCIETELDPHNVSIKLLLNGEVKQKSVTSNLIFKVPEMVAFVSQVMTLYPGDVILTGTPAGVGPMHVGDTVTVEIEGIGQLENTIVQG